MIANPSIISLICVAILIVCSVFVCWDSWKILKQGKIVRQAQTELIVALKENLKEAKRFNSIPQRPVFSGNPQPIPNYPNMN